jgi:hypothetical protein
MTLMMAVAASGSKALTGSATLADTKAGANALASIRLNTAGTITYVGSGSSGPANWWLGGGTPTTLYCTNTVTGTVPSVGAAPLTPTTGTCLWQWVTTGIGTITANGTIRMYYDAAGTRLAGTITHTVTCTRTS